MATTFCFACNIGGFRIFCLTPKQTLQEAGERGDNPESSRNVFFTKKRRETYTRNTLMVFYFLAGLAGVGLIITNQVGVYFRGPSEFCQFNYIEEKAICDMKLSPTSEQYGPDIVFICLGTAEILMAVVGMVAALKSWKRVLTWLAVGFLLALLTQVSVASYVLGVESSLSDRAWSNPYVPQKELNQAENQLTQMFQQALLRKDVYALWNDLQQQGCCCGVNGSSDWVQKQCNIPASCDCKKSYNNDWKCSNQNYYYDDNHCANPVIYDNGTAITKAGCLQYYNMKYGRYRGRTLSVICLIICFLPVLLIPAISAPLVAVCCRNCCLYIPGSNSVDMPNIQSENNVQDEGDVPLLHDDDDEGEVPD